MAMQQEVQQLRNYTLTLIDAQHSRPAMHSSELTNFVSKYLIAFICINSLSASYLCLFVINCVDLLNLTLTFDLFT